MKTIVVLTGAGISAESGLKPFRDGDGLWEGHNVYEVATPQAWRAMPRKVQDFYNMRRKAVLEAQPNAAHVALAELGRVANVRIVTQNIDNLHERAGSAHVLHLHGLITKARSSVDPDLLYDIDGWELKMGEKCEKGSPLRPHVVWFGEDVPMMKPAIELARKADIFMVVGTSMQVYPAASLVQYAPLAAPVYVIDPHADDFAHPGWHIFAEKAGTGVPKAIAAMQISTQTQ